MYFISEIQIMDKINIMSHQNSTQFNAIHK